MFTTKTVRGRIAAIRLVTAVRASPGYADKVGVHVQMKDATKDVASRKGGGRQE